MEKLYIVQDLQDTKIHLYTYEEYKHFLKNLALHEYVVNKGYYKEDDLSTLCHLENMLFFKNIEKDVLNNNVWTENIISFLNEFEYKVKEIEF